MTQLIGVDFTSAPGRSKPITVAHGGLSGNTLVLEGIEAISDWPAFDALLRRSGPWLGAFDLPFGLPRAGVEALGWPATNWATQASTRPPSAPRSTPTASDDRWARAICIAQRTIPRARTAR